MLPNSYLSINNDWNFWDADSEFFSAFKSALKWFWIAWKNEETENIGVSERNSNFFFTLCLVLVKTSHSGQIANMQIFNISILLASLYLKTALVLFCTWYGVAEWILFPVNRGFIEHCGPMSLAGSQLWGERAIRC